MRGIDRTGMKYNRLTVLRLVPKEPKAGKTNRWLCLCDCGKETEVSGGDLSSGKVKSCGCSRKEANVTHGMRNTRVYRIWAGVKKRMTNPNEPCYGRYGGRGLEFEEDWKSFDAFYADMGDPPSPDHSIDRKDNSLGYVRGNCRWATAIEQMNNTRKNRFYEYNGKTLTLAQWAREVDIHAHTLFMRVEKYGWSVDRALTTPVKKKTD